MKSTHYKDPPKVLVEENIRCQLVGTLNGGVWDKRHEQSRRVYGIDGLSPTIHTMGGGGQEIKIIEPTICAMRGRNPLTPTSRKAGEQLEQMLEIKNDGTSNTLTTVQKDNLVIEPMSAAIRGRNGGQKLEINKSGLNNALVAEGVQYRYIVEPAFAVRCVGNINPSGNGMNGNVFSSEEISPTLTTNKGEGNKVLLPQFRVRKLIPLETWRLMGFTDEDFDKAQKALNDTFYGGKDRSSSQLYKQAGNSIGVPVLEHIFKQMTRSD